MTDPTNYPGNSNKKRAESAPKREEKPKVKRVVQSEVIQRQETLGSKIARTFAGDDAHSVGSYILFEVMIPAAKTMISDAVSQGIERMLFGDGVSRTRSSSVGRSGYTSYSRMHNPNSSVRSDAPRAISNQNRARRNFDEIVLPTRDEAEEVLSSLIELVDQYDVATVGDLYDLVGITGQHTDEKWGWAELHGATIRRVRDGHQLILPRPREID